jgi:hypothetical protein
LEIRCGDFLAAIHICDQALTIHHGTGRLWATLVQLRQHESVGVSAQQLTLQRALNAVPKSGEVWCEGARLHLNPFSATFNLQRSRRHLFFATKFTPQYGDGFVETVRLEILCQWLDPIAEHIWKETRDEFDVKNQGSVNDALTKYIFKVALSISAASKTTTDDTDELTKSPHVHQQLIKWIRAELSENEQRSKSDLNDVRLACVNADPNYGSLWFHCRQKATDSPRRIIEDAAGLIANELRTYAHFYLAAMVRHKAVMSTLMDKAPATNAYGESIETRDPATASWEGYIDSVMLDVPSIEDIFSLMDPVTGTVLFRGPVHGPCFATALSSLNKPVSTEQMSLVERKKSLFGNDALFF